MKVCQQKLPVSDTKLLIIFLLKSVRNVKKKERLENLQEYIVITNWN